MSKNLCVNTNSKDFKELLNKYNIYSGNLESALYQLPNAGEDMSILELSDYIEQYFNFNTSYIEEDDNYDKILAIYDEYQKLGSIENKEKALQLFDKARAIFNDNVRLFQDTDNNWRINVAKPISKALNDEYESILKNAPRDKLERLLAPNGKPSNLNERLYALVRTKSFKDWFGDWQNDPENASKVTDENGEPLVVYHGGMSNINTFYNMKDNPNYKNTKHQGYTNKDRVGIYFTKYLSTAKGYASSYNKKQREIYAVFLNIRTIKEVSYRTTLKNRLIKYGTFGLIYKPDVANVKEEELTSIYNNYDGINHSNGEEFVVFDSNQIKSAESNIGTFSRTNDNIYYTESGRLITTKQKEITSNEIINLINEDNYQDVNIYNFAKKLKAIVLNSKVSDLYDKYITKSRGIRPKLFYDLTNNVLYVKSNNYRNSRLYDIVNPTTGEIVVQKLPLYTKQEYIDLVKQRTEKLLDLYKGTTLYSVGKTTLFALMNLMPSKLRFKTFAKLFLYDAIKHTGDIKENTINFDIIDKYVDSLPDNLWEYVSTSMFTGHGNITASTTKNNPISVLMPKLGLIRTAEEISGIRLEGYKTKSKYKFKWRDYDEILTLLSKGLSKLEVEVLIREALYKKGYFKQSSEKKNIEMYAKNHNMTVSEVEKILERNRELDDINGSSINQNILNYDWQWEQFKTQIELLFNKQVLEYIKNRYKDVVTLDNIPYLSLFFSELFNWLNIAFNSLSGEDLEQEKLNNEPLYRLASILHEPFHALHALSYGTQEELQLREAYNKLMSTPEGQRIKLLAQKTLNLSLMGVNDLLSIDNIIYKEICAYMWQIINTPKELINNMPETLLSTKIYNYLKDVLETPSSYSTKLTIESTLTGEELTEQQIKLNFILKLWNTLVKTITKIIPIAKNYLSLIESTKLVNRPIVVSTIKDDYDIRNISEIVERKNRVNEALNEINAAMKTLASIDKFTNVSYNINLFFSNKSNYNLEVDSTDNRKLNQARQLVEKIKEYSKEHVRFDASAHTYYLDGVKVDTTASKEAYGDTNIPEEYTFVSSRIGNTVDKFGRIFFNKELDEQERIKQLNSLPNLNRLDKNLLYNDFNNFKRYLDNKFGEGKYEVITDEIPIVSKYRYLDKEGKPITKTIGGTVDMLIIDSEGNFHIYDMKTKRIDSELLWREDTKTGYDKLLMIYKAMFESNWPELTGKIKELKLLRFDTKYPSPMTNTYTADNELLILDGVSILNHGDYTAPTLSVVSNGIFDVTQKTLENMEFKTFKLKKPLVVEAHNRDWNRDDVEKDTKSLYIFTDNTDRDSGSTLINPNSKYAKKYGKNKHYPKMTQAVIRGLDNAMPLSTQRWYHQGAKGISGRWKDTDIEEFKRVITQEIQDIIDEWNTGKYERIVVGRGDGFFNTKISNISKERVPKLYDFLYNILNEAGIMVSKESNKMSLKELTNDDVVIIKEEIGENGLLKESPQNITQTDSLYNQGLMSATERRFLSNTAMYYVSYIISHLQNSAKANETYFDKEFINYNFTKMSRKDIIDTIGIPKILNYIKEAYYNPDNRSDITDFDVLDKLQVIYDNWGAATMSAYSKLITLEDTTIIPSTEVKKEGTSLDDDDLYSSSSAEEKEREYWQIGQKQVSARASLSNEIKREFERLPIKDSEGKYVTDKYGYKFMTFVDSGQAIDSIYSWTTDCTTMSEMEKVLEEKAAFHPWLNQILDKIKKEPFRSMFFQNFRKQSTQYGIVTVDTDMGGNKVYNVNIINTNEASKVLLDRIVTGYNEGLLKSMIIPLKDNTEGKGKVNVESVTRMHDTALKILGLISKYHSSKSLNKLFNDKNLKIISDLLRETGILTDVKTLKEAFSGDSKYQNVVNTNSYRILNKTVLITNTLLNNKDKSAYNPIDKAIEDGNVYGDYKDIIKILSRFIHDSVEASTYENGKMYYSFVTPSYMGKLITNLKNSIQDKAKFERFIQSEYGRYRFFKDDGVWKNEWLKILTRDSNARDRLDFKVQLMYDGTGYTELSELGYTLSLMQEYFYDRKKKYAWYRVPILANKPSSEFVRFNRYSGLRYKDEIKRGLKSVFDQELLRIKTVLERTLNNDISKIGVKDKITFDLKESMITDSLKGKIRNHKLTLKDFVKNGVPVFKGSGAEFKFLDVLNNELIKGTELGQLIIDKINGVNINEEEFNKLFNNAIDSYMRVIVDNQINEWRKLGLYDIQERTVTRKDGTKDTVRTYKYISNIGKNEDEVNKNLEEYIWNDMFATINIIELTATDLAYYKNVEDFQKRYAQIHSPAMRLNTEARVLGNKYHVDGKYSADGMERTIYLADCIEKSEIIDNIKIAFDNKIATLSGIEKEHMKMTRDMVLSEFEKINVADAQGYSSPTSYRKKMGMSGRWTEEMEEAYNRIVSGNYNTNDLNIIWQPLKPFVYSQIPKSSGATTMKELKVPVHNKNSEYMLFLADAIMRGDAQKNKLIAIFDFMEDSAFDGRISDKGKVIKQGKYNGVGIDTVQFVSAVNSGSMGAIDINDIDDYDTIKQRLNDMVYYNTDKSETSDNAMDRYNDQHVHTIPYEDYGIQQEVPAHLRDHEQLMGSQMRILSVSDISPDAKFEINGKVLDSKQLVDEYQKLVAENIKDSFKQLIKDFNLKGTKKEKNKALSDLLVSTILKDQRYGADLLRACSLNKDGEFVIPLSDPIQSTRIQQLLNSIIKSRINKQTITGGPVVQVSPFGLSDDLKIVFDEKNKGKVKYFECYMPIPSTELEEALTKKDGTLMTVEEAIEKGIMTEEMRKAIGFRIPTEHKYSMAPLMIKGFLPKAAGEGIMLPKEITKLAGSDYDIDKCYVMLKSFNVKTFDTERFIASVKAAMEKQGASKEAINKFIYGNDTEDSLKEYLNKIRKGVSFTTTVDGEEKVDKKGLFIYDLYTANKSKFKIAEFKEIKDLKTKEGRNNRIFDLQWAVLTNEDIATQLFNFGSFDVQKKSARIINLLKTGNYTYEYLSKKSLKELDDMLDAGSQRNIIFSGTQVYFHKQNMTAGKLIGIFANNNTSHSFISMQDIYLNIPSDSEFMFDGISVNNSMNNKLDAMYGKNGELISKNIAGYLAASVDAVKDPVLNAMNLNTFTANTAMLLARLGFDTDSIGMFLTQPIIEEVTREYFRRNNEGYVTVDELINEVFEGNEELIKGIGSSLKVTEFTKNDLAEGLKSGSINTDFQKSVLVLFGKLASMAQDLNTLTFITKFNSVTNAVGPTIADTMVMRERYNKFIDKMEDTPPFSESAKYVLENSPILDAFYSTTLSDSGAARLIFQEYFPHYSDMFTLILEKMRGLVKGQLDAKTINKLINDFMLYKLTLGDNPVIDSSEKIRSRYINGFTNYYMDASKDISNNDFIDIINIKSRNNRCPVPVLEAKTGGYSVDLQERIKSGWSDLIINPATRNLGITLFYYDIFRSGFGFSPKTFGNQASVDVKLNIPGYVDTIRNPNFNDGEVEIESFIYQFFRNHTQNYKLVPKLEMEGLPKGLVTEFNDLKGKGIDIKHSISRAKIEPIIVEVTKNGIVFAPVISYNDKIYMLYSSNNDDVKYLETTTLGNPNNFLEYGPEGKNMKTVVGKPVYYEKEVNNEPSNDNVPSEPLFKKSFTTKELLAVFDSAEAGFWEKVHDIMSGDSPIGEKSALLESIVELVMNDLNIDINNEGLRSVITKKVKEQINKYC